MKEGDKEKIGLVDFIRSCVKMSVLLHGNNSVFLLPSIHAATNREEIRKDQGNHLIIKTSKKVSASIVKTGHRTDVVCVYWTAPGLL